MEILEKIKEANKLLNEVEMYFDAVPIQQSKIDSQLSDLYHYIENNNLNAIQACKIIKQIKLKRQERRKLLNDYELLKIYKNNSTKLSNNQNRQFLLAELNKTEKSLKTAYKNRIYTEEQFRTLNFED